MYPSQSLSPQTLGFQLLYQHLARPRNIKSLITNSSSKQGIIISLRLIKLGSTRYFPIIHATHKNKEETLPYVLSLLFTYSLALKP